MNKRDNLQNLKKTLDIKINGLENIPKDDPVLFVSNHNCLMDIFYLPVSSPREILMLISSRLVFKREDVERRAMVHNHLHSLPIEAHGGRVYSEICLNKAIELLGTGHNVAIYPEGAYLDPAQTIYKGRTGASRILIGARNYRQNIHLVPVSINIKSETFDLNAFANGGESIEITFLEPINYDKYLGDFDINDTNNNNLLHHSIVDEAMQSIATNLSWNYVDEYIELFPKGNVMFPVGYTVDSDEAKTMKHVQDYQRQLDRYSNEMIRHLVRK